MRVLTTALLALAPSLALACPTAADLDTGIRFEVSDGAVEVYKAAGPGKMQATYSHPDGWGARVLLAAGVYLLEVVDIEDGAPVPDSRMTYTYPVTDYPVPQSGGGWDVVAVTFEGGELGKEAQSYRFGQETMLTIGACRYRMLPVVIRYPEADDDDPGQDTLHYLPDLGLAYLAASKWGDEPEEVYVYTGVEALE